jgi:hypothetical protein
MAALRAVAPRRQANILAALFIMGVAAIVEGALMALGQPKSVVYGVAALVTVAYMFLLTMPSQVIVRVLRRLAGSPSEVRAADDAERGIDALAAIMAARRHSTMRVSELAAVKLPSHTVRPLVGRRVERARPRTRRNVRTGTRRARAPSSRSDDPDPADVDPACGGVA